jgi:hypothetical protein
MINKPTDTASINPEDGELGCARDLIGDQGQPNAEGLCASTLERDVCKDPASKLAAIWEG